MNKLPKDIQELLDNTPKTSKKDLKYLKKIAKELENDIDFQKDLMNGYMEELTLAKKELEKMQVAVKRAWYIMDKIHDNDEADEWQNDYEHIVFKEAFEDLEREEKRRKALDDMTQKI